MIKYLFFLIKKSRIGFYKKFTSILQSSNIFLNYKFSNIGKIHILKNTNVVLGKDAKIIVKSGILTINSNYDNYEIGSFNLIMGKDSKLISNNNFNLHKNGHVILQRNARFELGSGYISRNCKIRCFNSITIGNDVAISENFTIWDDDAHILNNHEIPSEKKEIKIGNHVWIGNNVTVLKGVNIGNNVVIASNSLVNKDIPDNCLAGGIPTKVIKENINWK